MENIRKLNMALNYIEEHLDQKIDMKEISRIALCSEFHFSKMFSYLAGMSLSDYIRNRRLTLAATDLKQGGYSVLDVAIKYNYNSGDSFTRAFKKYHGILPSLVRSHESQLMTQSKLNFEITIKGGNEIEYKIIEKEQFNLIGFKKRVTCIHNGTNPEITEMYTQFTPDIIKSLKSLSNVEPLGILSASFNFKDRHLDGIGKLDHLIGVASTYPSDQFEIEIVPKSTYAVFTSCGPFPETLQDTWAQIYGQWFPSTGYLPTGGVELISHKHTDFTDPNFTTDIWIPIKK